MFKSIPRIFFVTCVWSSIIIQSKVTKWVKHPVTILMIQDRKEILQSLNSVLIWWFLSILLTLVDLLEFEFIYNQNGGEIFGNTLLKLKIIIGPWIIFITWHFDKVIVNESETQIPFPLKIHIASWQVWTKFILVFAESQAFFLLFFF